MKMFDNRATRYFDLQGPRNLVLLEGVGEPSKFAPVLPQYAVVSAGVILEPFLRKFAQTKVFDFGLTTIPLTQVGFGLIVGILLLPVAYRASFDLDKPVLVQLAALFPMGIGWQSLVSAVVPS